MKRRRVLYLTVLLSALLFTACDSGYDCSLNNIAYNRIGYCSINGDSVKEGYHLQEELTVILMVNGIEAEAIDGTNKEVQLPMSYTHGCDTVLFRYDGSEADTLFVQHSNIPFYQSMECGTVMYHNITGVEHTHNLIDSVEVVHSFVNFDGNENLKIYFIE